MKQSVSSIVNPVKGQKKENVEDTTQGKKTKGRKRHLAVDTMGLVIDVVVHSAGIQDRDGDNPVNQPENALLGGMFVSLLTYPNSVPWVVGNANNWIYNGTGL